MWYDGNNVLDELGVNFLPNECDFENNNVKDFINNVKERNLLPIDKLKIFYSSDLWDFSEYRNTNLNISYFRFDFSEIASCYKEDVKNYVLINIIEGRHKISIIKSNFYDVCRFLNFCYDLGILQINLIQADHVISWAESFQNVSVRTTNICISHVISFCEYYDANFEQTFDSDFYNTINGLIDPKLIAAEAENSKTPNLPQDYFDAIVSAAINTINDSSAPNYFRAMSCMILMESQVGLRTGELFELKVGCVRPVKTKSSDDAYYLEYRTWKRHRGTRTSSTEISYVNDLFLLGYNKILEISKNKRKSLGIDYLFVESYQGKSATFPVDPTRIHDHLLRLFEYYNKYFQTIFPEYQDVKGQFCYKVKHKTGDYYVVIPKITQFRVHVCSELYSKGVPLEYIEKFMSHLSASMSGYYIRPKHSVQENYAASMEILKGIVTKEALPIGPDKGLVDKIDQFIESNRLSVEHDLDEICKKLADNIPIRIKVGGVCIKSSKFRDCSKDAKTDEFFCAYGVCPNLFTFYYMVDVSYNKFCELTEAFKINESRGHVKQMQKNLNMIHTILAKELIPQLEELKIKLQEKGANVILEKHPQITHIVANLSQIEDEVEIWKQTSIQK